MEWQDAENRNTQMEKQSAILEEDKWNLKDEIAYYKGQLAAKDTRIAELEAQLMLANSSSSIAHDLLEQRDKRIAELEEWAQKDWGKGE
jgi:hypothetical protein